MPRLNLKEHSPRLEACAIAAAHIAAHDTQAQIAVKPLTDGGEGFCSILTNVVGGELQEVTVRNAVGTATKAKLGWVNIAQIPPAASARLAIGSTGRLAIIEMAQAAGLQPLTSSERNPWHTDTFGVGQMIQQASQQGADAILIGIGGSATNDLGTGALQALGLKATDSHGTALSRLQPAHWQACAQLNATALQSLRLPPLRIACDVDNPLLGARGATMTFARQKGLASADLTQMERLAASWAERLIRAMDRYPEHDLLVHHTPGAGAAGGLGFGLLTAFPSTEFVAGADLVLEWLNMAADVVKADFILTGEGRFDRSSLGGKGPFAVLQLAANKKKFLYCGAVESDLEQELQERLAPLRCRAITPADMPIDTAARQAHHLLSQALAHDFPIK
ncbi:MAG: glycerate kinase [Verrucomicrobia bacterium]|nr:glycerate kinase [Verrucomicrobiota bacterium]